MLARMKEDVLEQIVDDYLQMQGYFTTHNVRFTPPKDQHYVPQVESVPSDIDVVGLHPLHTGASRVMVVSCKSWQSGFAAPQILAQLRGEAKNPKRPRELQFPGAVDAAVGTGVPEEDRGHDRLARIYVLSCRDPASR
jgi:hypothetical protein